MFLVTFAHFITIISFASFLLILFCSSFAVQEEKKLESDLQHHENILWGCDSNFAKMEEKSF